MHTSRAALSSAIGVGALLTAACAPEPAPEEPTPAPTDTESAAPSPELEAIIDDAAATFEPHALDYEVLDAAAASELAEMDRSIYISAPLFSYSPTVWELSPILAPRDSLALEDSFVAGIAQNGERLQFLSGDCPSANSGYAFCSDVVSVIDGAAIVEEGSADFALDFHALSPNASSTGFWADRYVERSCDEGLHPCTLIPEDSDLDHVYDCEIVHYVDGREEWSWSALEHIPDTLVEHGATTPIYNPEDPYHCNAVQPVPDEGLVVASMRHVNSVVAIDADDGALVWTFGAYDGAEALTIEDPDGLLDAERQVLSGNHDVVSLGGGRYSIFDNGSAGIGTARFLVFSVDGTTATIETVVDDPDRNISTCTGSARPLTDDESYWVVSWGCSVSGVSVVAADGHTVARITVAQAQALDAGLIEEQWADQDFLVGTVSYAATVGEPGLLSR